MSTQTTEPTAPKGVDDHEVKQVLSVMSLLFRSIAPKPESTMVALAYMINAIPHTFEMETKNANDCMEYGLTRFFYENRKQPTSEVMH